MKKNNANEEMTIIEADFVEVEPEEFQEDGDKQVIKKVAGRAAVAQVIGPAVLIPVVGGAVDKAADKVEGAVNKIKQGGMQPISASYFQADDFNAPQLIKVVDGADFKKKAFAKDTFGAIQTIDNVTVLLLNSSSIQDTNLVFDPVPTNNAIYCRMPYKDNYYVSVESYWDKIRMAQLAELATVAHALGAIHYDVMVQVNKFEEEKKEAKAAIKAKIKLVNAGIEGNVEEAKNKEHQFRCLATYDFKKSKIPTRPELKWYQNDDQVNALINMVLDDPGSMTKHTMTLQCKDSLVMNAAQAAAIDATVKKLGGKIGASCKKHVKYEENCELVYTILF